MLVNMSMKTYSMKLRIIVENASSNMRYAPMKYSFYKNVAYVPIENMFKYGEAHKLLVGRTNVPELADDISKNGYITPLKLNVETYDLDDVPLDPEEARAYLANGAHRLAASRLLGYTHVPVCANDGDIKVPARFQPIPVDQMP